MKRLVSLLTLMFLIIAPSPISAQEAPAGSLTIHKTLSMYDTPGQPVEGAKFRISRIDGIDLSTAAGWQALREVTALTVADNYALIDEKLAATVLHGDTAAAHFPQLVVGAYLVEEIPSRHGDVALSAAAPFIVTIPVQAAGATNNVTVTTKAQTLTVLLNATASTIRPGETFNYIIEGNVPLPDQSGKLHRYVVQGTLANGLTETGDFVVELRSSGETWQLREGEHYTVVTPYNGVAGFVSEDRMSKISFTPAGLAMLAQKRLENPDLTVRYTIGIRASKGLKDGDQLPLTVYMAPDGYPEERPERVPSNEVILQVRVSDGGGSTTVPPFPTWPANPAPTPGQQPGVAPSAPTTGTGAASKDEVLGTAPNRGGGLASTGANVLAIAGAGILIALVGLFILWRNRGRGDRV